MNELKNKRDGLAKEIRGILDTAKRENSRPLTADEKAKIDTLTADAENYNKQIAAEEFLEDQKRSEARKHFENKTEENKLNEAYDVGRALRNHITGKPLDGAELEAHQEALREIASKGVQRKDANSLLIPSLITEKRATLSVSNQPALVKTNLLDNISMVQYPVVYKQLGVSVWNNVPTGSFAIPSLQNIIAGYAVTDSTASDISLTSAVKTLAPRWMQATAAFTRDFLMSATDSMQSQVFGKFGYAIESATDKQLMFDLTGATTAASYKTTGATRTYNGIVALKNAIPFSNAFVCSQRGSTFLMCTPNITGTTSSASPIWAINNTVAGVSATSSFVAPNGLYAFGDFSQYHIPIWSNAYEVLVDPYTEMRKGNIILNVSRIQNQGIGNPAAFAVATQGSFV